MKNRIWIMTLFPDYFESFLKEGVASLALKGERGVSFGVTLVNIREYAEDKYKSVDDAPFGGGPGMVMRADVLKNALYKGVVVAGNYGEDFKERLHVVYTSPRGKKWNNNEASDFAKRFWSVEQAKDLVFICGRYEGVDERFINKYVDEEISIGDYVLTGGELAVQCILDSALRYVPGTLGNNESATCESFEENLLEHPQYTRPQDFEGMKIPEVLLSGHHANIDKFRLEERVRLTKEHRRDLYDLYQNKDGKK